MQTQPAVELRQGFSWTRLVYFLTICICDLALICLSILASLGVHSAFSSLIYPLIKIDILHWPEPASLYLLGVFVIIFGFFYEGVYSISLTGLDRLEVLTKSLTWSYFIIILISFTIHRSIAISRLFLFSNYIFSLLLMVLVRPQIDNLLRRRLKIRANLELLNINLPADTLQSLHNYGFKIYEKSLPSAASRRNSRTSVIVNLDDSLSDKHLAELESTYHELAILAPAANVTPLGSKPINLRGAQLFVISHPLQRKLNQFIKRTLDIAGSLFFLFVFLPLYLLIALLIRLDSKGPIFFGQRRIGRHGVPYTIWKFRTMVVDAEAKLGQVLELSPQLFEEYRVYGKLKKDPRITRIGNWLRRFSLDELPQFWNVLVGDMSLVGPRPPADFENEIAMFGPAYAIILASMRPGITGIWQTNGRSDTTYACRRDFDIYYARNWTLWMDLAVLIKTIHTVFMPGAY